MTSPESAPPGTEDVGPGQLPRVFGRYVLFDRIGRGGMADIFLARADTAFGGSRLCVLKQILPQLSHDLSFERMLVSEAKLAAQLTHANVVQVFDLGRESDRLFIGMEYVEGFDLNQLLRALSEAKLGMPAEFALLIVREALRGLDYAHRAKDARGRPLGIVHRDVSPSNVLISFEGEVKLCDFGIARAMTANDEGLSTLQDRAPRVVGKSAYMAPEHARGESIDARADVFAAGILLWELCAGRRLYRGSEEQMLAQAKRAEIPEMPDRGLPNMVELRAILTRALAPNRDERFESAQDFLRALEEYALGSRLMVSQLRFGTFLTQHFGERILEVRRQRERAARAVASNIPPPRYGADESPSEQTPTVVAASAALSHDMAGEPTPSATLENPESLAGWSEPGADVAPSSPPQGARIPSSPAPSAALPGKPLSEAELTNSLMGLDVLSGQVREENLAREKSVEVFVPPPSVPPSALPTTPPPSQMMSVPPAPPEREWLWYIAAIAILALGLFGYLWR